MTAHHKNSLRLFRLTRRPAWLSIWHLWTVRIPRRSITGRLVRGRVWRRHDGRRWIYKKFVDANASGDRQDDK